MKHIRWRGPGQLFRDCLCFAVLTADLLLLLPPHNLTTYVSSRVCFDTTVALCLTTHAYRRVGTANVLPPYGQPVDGMAHMRIVK